MYCPCSRAVSLLAGISLVSAAEADVLFVKSTPTGAADCGSWADACALNTARGIAVPGDEIWVQAGVYGPIALKDGVKIIGGFAGKETRAAQSNPALNITVLDGDRIRTVVVGSNNPSSSVLRGFHIRNGFAGDTDGGGGLKLINSSATIVQCVFENNQATLFGAAVSIAGPSAYSSPTFVNCEFRYNGSGEGDERLTVGGGAIHARNGIGTFVNCLFHHNRAGEGGVLIVLEGGPEFVNCTFVKNQATIGYGGVFFDKNGRATFRNCILWGNTTTRGVGRYDQGFSGSGGTTALPFSDVQGGWPGSINADPLFQSFAGGNYELQSPSPCKNTGDNTALPADVGDLDWDGDTDETVPLDLAMLPRILGTGVDMGAYEAVVNDCNSDGVPDELEPDCNSNGVPDACDLLNGTSRDVDADGVIDECDTFVSVPTVSTWGLVILTLLLVIGVLAKHNRVR